MTKDDLRPVLESFKEVRIHFLMLFSRFMRTQIMMAKNVAQDIAIGLCESVSTSLQGIFFYFSTFKFLFKEKQLARLQQFDLL